MDLKEKRAPTLKDVAALANVSHPTASRVINNNMEARPVKKETIERVLAAAQQLNYRPNRTARSLRIQKSNYIGLSMPRTSQDKSNILRYNARELELVGDGRVPLADMVINMAVTGWARGYETVLLQRNEEEKGKVNPEDIFPGTVDGLLYLMPSLQHQEYKEIAANCRNFVLAGYCPPDIPIHSCDVDNERALYDLTRNLLECGPQEVLYIYSNTRDWLISERRLKGFRRALSDAGMAYRDENVWEGRAASQVICDWIQQRRSQRKHIDGIICANLESVAGVLHCLHETRWKCPEELQVVAICSGLDPEIERQGISCMHLPVGLIARRGCELLMDVIEGKVSDIQHLEVEPVFISRYSTKAKNPGSSAQVRSGLGTQQLPILVGG